MTKIHHQKFWTKKLLCTLTLALSWSVGMRSTQAAETITIRLGPFQQAVAIADLEKFTKTGKLPAQLEALSPILTTQVRELLTKRLEVDPAFADKFLEQLLQAPAGKQLISSLGVALPGSTAQSLQATLNLALRQINGVSVLSFLRAYPQENVTVDATASARLLLELNANHLQSQALGFLLARSTKATNTPLPTAFNPATIGTQTVQQQTLTLVDRQRHRTIPVDIYWSKGNTQDPLVVISHGFGANRKFLSYLARHLASRGITVAALEHPGSNVIAVNQASNTANLARLLPSTEFIDRPKDISFLLDELAKLNTQPIFKNKFNTEKVTVIGHSLGGYTALALVGAEVDLESLRQFCKTSLNIGDAPGDWLQCAAASLPAQKLHLQDARVRSAIALNPLVGKLFGEKGITQVNQPVLILSGTEDALTPALTHQIKPFTQLLGTKYLLTAIGGTHLSVSDSTSSTSTAISVVKERRGEESTSLRKLIQGVSLAFIKQLTPEATIYQPFLTSTYAQSYSTPEMQLRLETDLPATIKPWLDFVTR